MGALTFAVGPDGSMFAGSDGNLAMLTDQDAMVQACTQRLSHLKGELLFAKTEGIIYMDTVFVQGATLLAPLQKNMMDRLRSMNHVLDVPFMRASFEGTTMKFVTQVLTEFGTIALRG